MKSLKRISFAIAFVSLFGLVGVQSAQAARTCEEATIIKLGAWPENATDVNSGYIVKASCADAVTKWVGERYFFLSTDLGKVGYSTLLTAVGLNKTVRLRVADHL